MLEIALGVGLMGAVAGVMALDVAIIAGKAAAPRTGSDFLVCRPGSLRPSDG